MNQDNYPIRTLTVVFFAAIVIIVMIGTAA